MRLQDFPLSCTNFLLLWLLKGTGSVSIPPPPPLISPSVQVPAGRPGSCLSRLSTSSTRAMQKVQSSLRFPNVAAAVNTIANTAGKLGKTYEDVSVKHFVFCCAPDYITENTMESKNLNFGQAISFKKKFFFLAQLNSKSNYPSLFGAVLNTKQSNRFSLISISSFLASYKAFSYK